MIPTKENLAQLDPEYLFEESGPKEVSRWLRVLAVCKGYLTQKQCDNAEIAAAGKMTRQLSQTALDDAERFGHLVWRYRRRMLANVPD